MGVDYSACIVYGYDMENKEMPEPFKEEVHDRDYGIAEYRDYARLHSMWEDIDFLGIEVVRTRSYGVTALSANDFLERQGSAVAKWKKFLREDKGLTEEFKEWSKENPPEFFTFVQMW